MPDVYVLRALDDKGNQSFWTGRAGPAWVSPDIAQAFASTSPDFARAKATGFNRFTPLHGLRFIAVRAVAGDYEPVHATTLIDTED